MYAAIRGPRAQDCHLLTQCHKNSAVATKTQTPNTRTRLPSLARRSPEAQALANRNLRPPQTRAATNTHNNARSLLCFKLCQNIGQHHRRQEEETTHDNRSECPALERDANIPRGRRKPAGPRVRGPPPPARRHRGERAVPYAAFFLVGVPTWIFPESWDLTAINLAIDTVLLILVLAFFAREYFPAFSYLRTRPVRKIALLFGLWLLVVIVQASVRFALYGGNPPVAENQQQVINALYDGTLGLAFSFFVTVGVPVIEEIFFRHILIGKLSAYAPTWLVASISAALFAYMHSHQWQDFFSYLPLSIVLTLVYVKSGKNVAYSWLFHALNNTIMVFLMFAAQGALQNA